MEGKSPNGAESKEKSISIRELRRQRHGVQQTTTQDNDLAMAANVPLPPQPESDLDKILGFWRQYNHMASQTFSLLTRAVGSDAAAHLPSIFHANPVAHIPVKQDTDALSSVANSDPTQPSMTNPPSPARRNQLYGDFDAVPGMENNSLSRGNTPEKKNSKEDAAIDPELGRHLHELKTLNLVKDEPVRNREELSPIGSPKQEPVRISRMRSPKREPVRKRSPIRSPKREPVRKRSPIRSPVRKRSPERSPVRKRSPERSPARKRSPVRSPVRKRDEHFSKGEPGEIADSEEPPTKRKRKKRSPPKRSRRDEQTKRDTSRDRRQRSNERSRDREQSQQTRPGASRERRQRSNDKSRERRRRRRSPSRERRARRSPFGKRRRRPRSASPRKRARRSRSYSYERTKYDKQYHRTYRDRNEVIEDDKNRREEERREDERREFQRREEEAKEKERQRKEENERRKRKEMERKRKEQTERQRKEEIESQKIAEQKRAQKQRDLKKRQEEERREENRRREDMEREELRKQEENDRNEIQYLSDSPPPSPKLTPSPSPMPFGDSKKDPEPTFRSLPLPNFGKEENPEATLKAAAEIFQSHKKEKTTRKKPVKKKRKLRELSPRSFVDVFQNSAKNGKKRKKTEFAADDFTDEVHEHFVGEITSECTSKVEEWREEICPEHVEQLVSKKISGESASSDSDDSDSEGILN